VVGIERKKTPIVVNFLLLDRERERERRKEGRGRERERDFKNIVSARQLTVR